TNPLPPVRIPETPPGTAFPTCHTRAGFSLANETPPEHLFGNAPFSLGFASRNAQRHFVRSRTPASAARAPATTLDVSSAASLPPRLRMRPSTTTVSTFSGPVASSTRCAGSVTTAMLSAFGLIAIRSARLPALSEPILSSIPIERAPSMVPSSSALRAGILNSLSARKFEHGEQVRASDQRRGIDRDAEGNALGQHLAGLRIAVADA